MGTKKEQGRKRSGSANARNSLGPLCLPPGRPRFDEIAAEMARFTEEEIRRQDEPLESGRDVLQKPV
jgi:hypothetical protein